jgi:hypothetical protein
LANNIRAGRQNLAWVLGTFILLRVKFEKEENWSHKTQVFHSIFSVYFSFAIIQFSNKNIPR